MGKTYNLTTFQALFIRNGTHNMPMLRALYATPPHRDMKLQPDKSNAPTINAYGEGWIEVNGQKFTQPMRVSSLPNTPPSPWSVQRFDALSDQDFAHVDTTCAELVIFGSGTKLRFPKSEWLAPLICLGIGVETMDTAAACRTYNILASEGRKVTALLLIEK